MDHLQYCDALEAEVERFADVMSLMPGDTAVATCPGWTVDDTALHLGVIHRWAEELVRTRSSTRIPRTTPSLDGVSITPGWLREGGKSLVATLRHADPDEEMWAWGLDQHVRFWSRRQVHETLVHRMDLELAGRIAPAADAVLASDAIDEFLHNLQKVANSATSTALWGNGERLAFRARDAEAVWVVTLRDGGFDLGSTMGHYDVMVAGPSLELLLAIVGRVALDDTSLDVAGEVSLADFWLVHSAFE